MRDWVAHEDEYLQELIALDGCRQTVECIFCKGEAPKGASTWRCLSCIGMPEGCRGCMLESHCKLPFHKVEEWVGDHWSASTTKELGVELCMGHAGARCTKATQTRESTTGEDSGADGDQLQPDQTFLIVVDISGVHKLPIVWCRCDNAADRHIQLLRMRLYPASQQFPRTAFSFAALHDFMISNLEMKVPANAYFRKLRYVTNDTMPDDVPVNTTTFYPVLLITYCSVLQDRYRELARCYRQWIRIKTRQEHGHGFGLPDEEQEVGSMAHFCAACPQPGKNLPENWKSMG